MEEKWSLRDIEEADYELLLELFMTETVEKKEEVQDATDFFASFLSPTELAKAKGEIE
jgi:hypothetical protein